MEKKCQIDDSVSSSTAENKTSIQNQRESEASVISSEWVESTQQNSLRSDLTSVAGQCLTKARKDSDAGRAEVSQGDPSKTAPEPCVTLRTPSLCSKESSDLVQLSSADSIDQKPCQSLNENTSEKQSHTRLEASRCSYPARSDEFLHVQKPDLSHMTTKSDPSTDNLSSKHPCKFDLNEDMDANGVECPQKPICGLKSSAVTAGVSEPISVLAKVGVPVGLPEKPLQFGGELGWRRSANTSAFRPTSKNSDGENGGSRQSLASRGIDLNIAATMDSEFHADEISLNISSKQSERFFLDLNCQSENRSKQGASGFDLNDNPGIRDNCKSVYQISDNRQTSKDYVCTGSMTGGSQFMPDSRRPSYWVDLRSMPGFHQVQSFPFLVAAPTAEQVRMVVPLPIQSEISFLPQPPSRLEVDKVQISPTFYPHPGMLPYLNNQHPTAAVIPHLTGSVVAAYPGALHVLDSPQLVYPAAYATPIRPTFAQNVEFLVPTRHALFQERMKPVERVPLPLPLTPSSAKRREPDGGWDYSQANYIPMASWN